MAGGRPGREIAEFLRMAGVRRVGELDDELLRVFGPVRGRCYIDQMSDLFDAAEARVATNIGLDPHVARQTEMVDLMHDNDELAAICASFYDADLLPPMLESLRRCQACFGPSILDMGCGNGIATCFVAKTHPDAQVIGCDVSSNALACADRLAGRLGVGNVRFAPPGEVVGRMFDTVLSLRTFHENMAHVPSARMAAVPHAEQVERYVRLALPYAQYLAGFVAPRGRLVTIERVIDEPTYEGMVRALASCGLRPAEGRPARRAFEREFTCANGNESVTLRVAVFERD